MPLAGEVADKISGDATITSGMLAHSLNASVRPFLLLAVAMRRNGVFAFKVIEEGLLAPHLN
jgi:hypothetical protein